ncbi:MAG: SGNH/GDSL hydrolase family protein, partial [Planctomycetaceae bacterium]|nr:SGNH/GDSL hydrolase family protein [Planctomycetaceae bacterium]
MTNSQEVPRKPWYSLSRKRVVLWLTLSVCSVGGALLYLEFWYHHPVGSGPAGPEVDAASFSTVWSERPVVLLGLGDSITDGYGASPGKSYFNLLLKPASTDTPSLQHCYLPVVLPNIKGQNDAISGTTSLELVDVTLPRLEPFPPDVYG